MVFNVIYQNAGLTIFLALWLFGIISYLLRKDDNLFGIAIVYTLFYGFFKIITSGIN